MLQTPKLTEQNLKDYERDGFVIVRNTFNVEDTANIDHEKDKEYVFRV